MKKHELALRVFDQAAKDGKIDINDLNDVKAGKKTFEGDEIFIRKQLAGTQGVIEVIDENDVTKNCVTNLSKGSIPKEKNFVVDKIALRFGWSATSVAAAAIAYSNNEFDLGDVAADGGAAVVADFVYARRIPVQIRNAEYTLSIDGNIVDSGRVSGLLSTNVSTDGVNGHEKNFKQLEYPKLFAGDKRVKFDLKFPENGAAVPAGFYYIEIVAKGLGLGKKAQ